MTSTGTSGVYFFNVWQVEPDKQQALFDLFVDMIEKVMKPQAGFRSSKLFKSLDGTQVIVYAEWTSKDEWKKSLDNPETLSRVEKMKELGTPNANLYQVGYQT